MVKWSGKVMSGDVQVILSSILLQISEICTSELLCNVPGILWRSWKLVTGETWLWSGEAVATSIDLERYHHFLSRESLGLTEPCYRISMIFRVCYVMVCYVMLHDWTDTLNHLII